MDAFVKLKGIDMPIQVPDITCIKSHEGTQSSETTDFRDMRFNGVAYYSFIGSSILHVYGKNIEYIYFQIDQ